MSIKPEENLNWDWYKLERQEDSNSRIVEVPYIGPKELAERAYDRFGNGDLDGLLELLSDDIVWELVGPTAIPYFGRYVGKSGVKSFFEKLMEHEEILTFLPEEYIENGDTVAVTGREVCKSRFYQREYNAKWVQVFKVKEGKISSWCEYIDSASVLEAYRMPATGPF